MSTLGMVRIDSLESICVLILKFSMLMNVHHGWTHTAADGSGLCTSGHWLWDFHDWNGRESIVKDECIIKKR